MYIGQKDGWRIWIGMLWLQVNMVFDCVSEPVNCCLKLNKYRSRLVSCWICHFRKFLIKMRNNFRSTVVSRIYVLFFFSFFAWRICIALTGIRMAAYSLRCSVSEICDSPFHTSTHVTSKRLFIAAIFVECEFGARHLLFWQRFHAQSSWHGNKVSKYVAANDTNRRCKKESNGRNSCKKVDFFRHWILIWSTKRISFQSCMHFQAWLIFTIFDH